MSNPRFPFVSYQLRQGCCSTPDFATLKTVRFSYFNLLATQGVLPRLFNSQ